ncbi:MAG: hypothetical protein N7Q72_05540 [Spiroplasma sp. Tabriz.8]|nr:hypothetical protein [Spiroplasma sp. Tabriz.8]
MHLQLVPSSSLLLLLLLLLLWKSLLFVYVLSFKRELTNVWSWRMI